MKQKILIVDDSPDDLMIMKTTLEEQTSNIEIISAGSSEEALTVVRNNDFSLAIIDVMMSKMSGYELAEIIHKNKNSSKLPIIFISALYSEDSKISEAYQAGAVDFLKKPINPIILLSKIKTFLKLDQHARKLESMVKSRTRELNNALEEWNLTFDSIYDYVSIIDCEHNILIANKAMIDAFGKDIIGKKCYHIFHTAKEIPFNCPVIKMMEDIKAHRTVINETFGDEDKYFDVSVFPIKDKSGEIDKYVHIVRDITEYKKTEELLQHNKKMQAIGQLAGGIAHDFNNQLTAIQGYATLLKNKVKDNETLTKFADIIITATKRSADLTQKLLAFARKGVYKKTENDIHKLLEEAGEIVSRTINKKVKVNLELNADNSVVSCDSSQIANAFLNLMINANDAMPDGGTLTVTTENVFLTSVDKTNEDVELAPGEYIEIKFKDTGTGIPANILNRIFEPFFSTKKEKGTGLGLSAVYGTITGHHGSVNVLSKKNRGTEFIIKLPISSKNIHVVSEDIVDACDNTKDTLVNKANILLVDDEEVVREYAQEVITTLGHNVISSCCNGKEAVDFYSKKWKDIDLVLLDILMPEMDGKEAYKKMKKINPNIKVIFISGYSDDDTKDLLNSDSVSLIKKPFDLKTISDAFKQTFS